ncbi:hypothetical protein JCM3766R1_005075 [Sporobolomyces carnicolor]
MPATSIRSLPFELIEHILDVASGPGDVESKASIASRNQFLSDAALICRDFRYPAQSCLWKVLRVHTPETARKLLASKCLKCYATRELSLEGVHSGSDGLSGSTATRVISKVIGVRTLRLMDFGRLSLRVLQYDNLSTLRTLYLMSSFPDKSTTVTSLSFPFHLRSLHLFNRAYSSNLLPTLFNQCATTLTSLTLITSHSSPSYPSLVKAFPAVARNLVHLSLQHRPSADLTASFDLCTRLARLDCSFAVDLASTLDSLENAPLKTLSIELDYNLVDVAQVLLHRLDSTATLAQLDVLKFPIAPARAEFREFGGQGLLDRCQEKGITVEVGQVVAWRTRSVFD